MPPPPPPRPAPPLLSGRQNSRISLHPRVTGMLRIIVNDHGRRYHEYPSLPPPPPKFRLIAAHGAGTHSAWKHSEKLQYKNNTHHEVAQLGIKLCEASRSEEDDDLVSRRVGFYVLTQKLAQLLRLRRSATTGHFGQSNIIQNTCSRRVNKTHTHAKV